MRKLTGRECSGQTRVLKYNKRLFIPFYLLLLALLVFQTILPSLIKADFENVPHITNVSPRFVRLEGGAEVLIRGSNFSHDSIVVFGDTIIKNAEIVSRAEIRFRVPPQKLPGAGTVSVHTAAGMAQRELIILPKSLSELRTGEIATIAGGMPFLGDGQKAIRAALLRPEAIAIDAIGNLFVADSENNRVRRIEARTGFINTVAGNGRRRFDGDNGPAITASLNPEGVAVDKEGNLFIADFANSRVRRVDAITGIITTVAGNGDSKFSGDGGPAILAGIDAIRIVLDESGNMFIVGSNRIRRVDAITGIITTVAGNGNSEFNGDGVPATEASVNATAAAVDRLGNLFIVDGNNRRIRRVDSRTGIIKTVAGNGIAAFKGDGRHAGEASLVLPTDIALDQAGNLFITDIANNRVRRIDVRSDIITTVAGNGRPGFSGDGGPANGASINSPAGIAVDSNGHIFISADNRVRRVDARTRKISTYAGSGDPALLHESHSAIGAELSPSGVILDEAGNLFIADYFQNRIRKVDAVTGFITTVSGNGRDGFSGDGGPAVDASCSLSPISINNTFASGSIALDSDGNLFIADIGNQRIRRVDAKTGIIETVAGGGTNLSGEAIRATEAMLKMPSAISLDGSGNMYIADVGSQRIRRVDLNTGTITTVIGNEPNTPKIFDLPLSVTVDRTGHLFIADVGKNRIFRLDTSTGTLSIVAGNGEVGFSGDNGLAVRASLNFPTGTVIDKTGNLFIVDRGNNRIRRVDARTGIITTVAGNDCKPIDDCPYGDNGQATEATLGLSTNSSEGIALDRAGNLYIADTLQKAIRVVKAIGK
jgi:trimeric autotransporter adhesin